MKRFILKTMWLILPILLVAGVMEVLLRNIPNDYLLKKQYLDAHSNEIETLILGSSHSFYGIDPTYITNKTFNASHVSQSLNYDYEILNKYQDQLRNLKTVVLPISYFSLFVKLEGASDAWRVKNYTIYYNMNTSRHLSNYTEILSNQVKVNIQRLYSYYIQGISNITCTALGWGTAYQSEVALDLNETGKTSAIRQTGKGIKAANYKDTFRDNVASLNLILQWSKDRNVKVILLTPPAFASYRNNLNKDQINITIKTTHEIASRYENCNYVNMLSDTNFIAKDYYDGDHLSDIGAKKLSQMINTKIMAENNLLTQNTAPIMPADDQISVIRTGGFPPQLYFKTFHPGYVKLLKPQNGNTDTLPGGYPLCLRETSEKKSESARN